MPKQKRIVEDSKRVRAIKDTYGKDCFSRWGKSGGTVGGGSPVLLDPVVMKLYYKRHPKR